MDELRLRFDELSNELITNYTNIFDPRATLKQREETGCIVGKLNTIAIFILNSVDDREIQDEIMFISEEFMGNGSNNAELNAFKFDVYIKYKRIYFQYMSNQAEINSALQRPTDLKIRRIRHLMQREMETIARIRKEIQIARIEMGKSLRDKIYSPFIIRIDEYIDKITLILLHYENQLPDAVNARNNRTLHLPKLGKPASPKPANRSSANKTATKPANGKTRSSANSKTRSAPVPKGKKVVPSLNIKQLLNKLKEKSNDNLAQIQLKVVTSKKDIKKIFDDLRREYDKLMIKEELLKTMNTNIYRDAYVPILQEIGDNISQIQNYL
jgi:hypothetical protein